MEAPYDRAAGSGIGIPAVTSINERVNHKRPGFPRPIALQASTGKGARNDPVAPRETSIVVGHVSLALNDSGPSDRVPLLVSYMTKATLV